MNMDSLFQFLENSGVGRLLLRDKHNALNDLRHGAHYAVEVVGEGKETLVGLSCCGLGLGNGFLADLFGFWDKLKGLVYLNMSDCKLTKFDLVVDLPKLRRLDLEGNQLDGYKE